MLCKYERQRVPMHCPAHCRSDAWVFHAAKQQCRV